MAIMRKTRLTRMALGMVVLLAAGMIYDVIRVFDVRQYNDALRRDAFVEAGEFDDASGVFAKAYALQRAGSFERSLKAYSLIENNDDPELERTVKFNMANLYLHRALELGTDGNDLAIPLIELAKENYRELLRADSGHWDAKYNLERALVLLPEPEPQDSAEEAMPERSRRAAAAIRAYRQLP